MLPISPQNKSRHNFFSKPHFPGDFVQTVDGNWFHSPNKTASAGSSGHISHGIWGSPRLTAAVTSHHCSGNTLNCTVAVWPNQPSTSLSFHLVFVHHQKLFAHLQRNSQGRPGGKGEPSSRICALAQGLGKSPARRNFTSGGMCTPGSSTAQLCPCEHPQSSISFWLAALSPGKTKGVTDIILLICRPSTSKSCLKTASIICSSMGNNQPILKGGHLRERGIIPDINWEKKKNPKRKRERSQSRSCLFIFPRGFFHLLLYAWCERSKASWLMGWEIQGIGAPPKDKHFLCAPGWIRDK